MQNKIKITCIIGVILLSFLIIDFNLTNFDYKLLTSSYTLSGLVNVEAPVVGEDIEAGIYNLCTKGNYINYSIKKYNKKEYDEYLKNGVNYDEEVYDRGHLNKHSCQEIKLEEGMVLEAFNNDWGKVTYYLKNKNN